MRNREKLAQLGMERLEPKRVLSLIFSIGGDHVAVDSAFVDTMSPNDELHVSEHHNPGHGGGPGGGGPPGGGSGPAIDLPTVALHEFGHSLGLNHSSHSDCGSAGQPIMCPFYIGEATTLQAEDVARIQALYPSNGGNGTWNTGNDITYSFMPDGARMDQGKNSLFTTMNAAFGSEAVWQGIFADALNEWAAVESTLNFTKVSDDGSKFNANGDTQGDPDFGDIRIGSHRFDGASGTLAHAYFPPPNGATAAGDAHFDQAENWVIGAGRNAGGGGGGGGGGGELNVMPGLFLTGADVGTALADLTSQDQIKVIEETASSNSLKSVDLETPVLALSHSVEHLNEALSFNFGDSDRHDSMDYQTEISLDLDRSLVAPELQ